MENDIKSGINTILEETTKFDFPFLANEEKKKRIILEKKLYIEKRIKDLFPATYPKEEELQDAWNEAIAYANDQFKSLPEKRKLNGFYLQELLHYYVELLGNIVVSNAWGGII